MNPRSLRPLSWMSVDDEVAGAVAAGKAVVALETTVLTHGLPRPANLEVARRMEAEVRAAGALPATIGVLDGVVYVGLAADRLERLATTPSARKVSRRDLAAVVAKRGSGGTTVAATMAVARLAGIQVFATGGIGGVHRGAGSDISADLPELARTPVAVVSSGAKAILDLPRTLEWLETAGVPVVGWQTDEFPAFYSRSSGLSLVARVDAAEEAGHLVRTHWELDQAGGVLLCVPCPEEAEVPMDQVLSALRRAEAEASADNVRGPELTPYLLNRLVELTDGATLRANMALLRRNARVAGGLAAALASQR